MFGYNEHYDERITPSCYVDLIKRYIDTVSVQMAVQIVIDQRAEDERISIVGEWWVNCILRTTLLFVFGATPPVGQGLLIHDVSRSHTTTHHSR